MTINGKDLPHGWSLAGVPRETAGGGGCGDETPRVLSGPWGFRTFSDNASGCRDWAPVDIPLGALCLTHCHRGPAV